MTIAHCPKCREQVTVPLGASRQAQVRCPLCAEEYLLDDALRSLPPQLVVVHDPEGAASEIREERPVVFGGFGEREDPQFSTEDSSEGIRIEAAPPVAAFKFEHGSAVAAPRSSSVSTTRPRARRKQGSPLRLIVQTVGGGVLGLVIAQLILFWMPGNWAKENRDPFGLAPKIGTYIPYVVPSTLRGSPTAQAESGEGSPAALDSTIPDFTFNAAPAAQNAKPRPQQQAAKKSPAKEKPQETAAPPLDEFPLPGLDAPPDMKLSPPGPDALALPEIKLDPIDPQPVAKTKAEKVEESSPPVVEPVKESTPATEIAKDKTDTKPSEANAPAATTEAATIDAVADKAAAEISKRLSEVASAAQAWDTAVNPDIPKKRELIIDLYNKLALLGETVAQIEAHGETNAAVQPVVANLHTLAHTLAGQQDKLVPLGQLAGIRLSEDRDRGGLVVGVVLSHQPSGNLFETQLRLSARSEPVVTVVSSEDLSAALPANSQVLVLGRWISNPADNLAGYEGQADSVLLRGVHAKVPATTPQP